MPRRAESGAEGIETAEKKQRLLELTGAFCDAHLNADYKRLCKKIIDRMAKQRSAPFLRGRLEIWAAGIVHALGSINFLFDKSFQPYVGATDIAAFFQVAPGSASQKATAIRDMFELSSFNTEYMTKQMRERMAPTFAAIQQMDQMFGGLRMRNDLGDVIEDGQFIARESAVQSRYYNLVERYQKEGPTPAVAQALDKLIAQDPDFYDPYLALRDILIQYGRAEEADALLEIAYQRALSRLIMDDEGHWPAALEWGWLENRHIIRALLNKALAEWTAGNTDAALDLLRKLLRSNPGDNIGARDYILAIRLGMTFEGFENRFMAEFGYDALKMMEWFGKNSPRFPDEFDWWKKAVEYEE